MAYQNYTQWKTEPIANEPYLSIIIPAYNEEVRILPTIGAIASYVSDLGFDWELIIADDGSKDQTIELVKELNLANLHLLEAPQNGGKGSAVQRGMLIAKGKFLLFTDADNSTPIEEVVKLLAKVDGGGYDIAVGSRAVAGAEEANKSFLRKFLSRSLNLLVQNVLRIPIKDTQCGFKLYSRAAARKLHQTQTMMGFSFDLEILYLAIKYGFKIAEIPVAWVDAPGSKVDTTKEAQRFLKDMVKIKTNDWRGVYV